MRPMSAQREPAPGPALLIPSVHSSRLWCGWTGQVPPLPTALCGDKSPWQVRGPGLQEAFPRDPPRHWERVEATPSPHSQRASRAATAMGASHPAKDKGGRVGQGWARGTQAGGCRRHQPEVKGAARYWAGPGQDSRLDEAEGRGPGEGPGQGHTQETGQRSKPSVLKGGPRVGWEDGSKGPSVSAVRGSGRAAAGRAGAARGPAHSEWHTRRARRQAPRKRGAGCSQSPRFWPRGKSGFPTGRDGTWQAGGGGRSARTCRGRPY